MHDKEWEMRDVTLCNVQNVHSSEQIFSRTQSELHAHPAQTPLSSSFME